MTNPKLELSSKLTPLFDYIKKNQESRKIRETVELAATFILISFFLFFAIRPTVLTISALIGEIKSKELLSKEMKKKISSVILAQDLFSQVQERYSVVESCLPVLPRFSQATSQIEGLLTQQLLEVGKLDFQIKAGQYFSTSIATASSFTSGINLIAALLQNRRLLEIPNLGFSVDKESTGSRQVTLNLPLNIYYWRDQVREKK
jgi:hypothetical protein